MKYEEWKKMSDDLKKMSDKVTAFFQTVDKCADATQMYSVRVKANVLQELINKLEESVNIIEYFTCE